MGVRPVVFEELKEKALSLPLAPGVYIMRDRADKVIYVGKAKKLKNRVGQYFQDTASHSPKTRLMVSKIHKFDVIVAATEFEALVLECSLIKRYQPKYNILLKDDKGYPYVRLDLKPPYPTTKLVNRVENDGANYYGPFGSRGLTNGLLESIRHILMLPDCSKRFPRDIGKDRPCLNYHMNLCAGWCQPGKTQESYRERIGQMHQLLSGSYKKAAQEIRTQMLEAAGRMEFELAAGLRDRLSAVEALGKKQLVTAGSLADTDVIGYGYSEAKACFAVLHFSDGNLLDKDYEVFPVPDDHEAAVSALMKQYYLSRGTVPKRVLLPFHLEDGKLFAQLLEQQLGRKPYLRVPKRGDGLGMLELANKNAHEEAQRVTSKEEKISGTLLLLGKMLNIDPPARIESYDISNISGTDIVGSMVVFQDGKSKKGEYKKFKIEGLQTQDDYASMAQIITRRFAHYLAGDAGFESAPSLLLIDGGINHARTAEAALGALDLHFPVFGMVKDDRHRTRALVTSDGREIRIDAQQAVFALVGNIQEETHRFAISYHRDLRSSRLRRSRLDGIAGVGPKRKEQLLKHFGTVSAISQADISSLRRVLPQGAAAAVWAHFHPQEES